MSSPHSDFALPAAAPRKALEYYSRAIEALLLPVSDSESDLNKVVLTSRRSRMPRTPSGWRKLWISSTGRRPSWAVQSMQQPATQEKQSLRFYDCTAAARFHLTWAVAGCSTRPRLRDHWGKIERKKMIGRMRNNGIKVKTSFQLSYVILITYYYSLYSLLGWRYELYVYSRKYCLRQDLHSRFLQRHIQYC